MFELSQTLEKENLKASSTNNSKSYIVEGLEQTKEFALNLKRSNILSELEFEQDTPNSKRFFICLELIWFNLVTIEDVKTSTMSSIPEEMSLGNENRSRVQTEIRPGYNFTTGNKTSEYNYLYTR